MQLYFVRHGESEASVTREFSCRGFRHPLTSTGVAQAKALAAKLAARTVSRIYSSPLLRAVQTAEILSQTLGPRVEVAPALREWDVGLWEGTTDERGWEMHRQIQEDWFVHGNLERRIPGGESFLDIRERFVPFIGGVVGEARSTDEAAVLVGHGGLFMAMLPVILANIDHACTMRHPLANTAYVVAENRSDGLWCLEWCGALIHGT
ncbi:MAG: hypothetical protein RLZZ387_1025 [Chloroflexota bacterium]|jgi:broad specificity phosphatase PhoE